MRRYLPQLVYYVIRFLRLTCRAQAENDPRARLLENGQPYIIAALHAHQIPLSAFGDPNTGTLVSRSKDGELIALTLKKLGIVPFRGSAGVRSKGGVSAFRGLVNHVNEGNPAAIIVDGPKGPRGVVRPGVASLSQKTMAPVVPVCFVSKWRVILGSTWDRTQFPIPFSKMVCMFAEPIYPQDGESVEDYTRRIQTALLALERDFDPAEAAIAQRNIQKDPPSVTNGSAAGQESSKAA